MKLFNFYKCLIVTAITAAAYSCGSSDDGNGINTDPNWVDTGENYCSTNPSQYTGQNGNYFFIQQQDRNQNSATYQQYRLIPDPSNDGRCATGYSPTVSSTNITTGRYISFATYGDRVFAAEVQYGILEYVNGQWITPVGMTNDVKNNIFYAKMKQGAGGAFFISCSKGIYYQTGDNNYKVGYPAGGSNDMSGGLGGSNTNFFASAGADWGGIFKWNGSSFISTNQVTGCFYSIEALNENDVFFGSYGKSNGSTGDGYTFGVMRWDNSQQKVVKTNLETGEYNVATFNNRMYAANGNNVYVWDGSTFNELYSNGGGQLGVTGGNLYLSNASGIYKFDGTTFNLMLSGDYYINYPASNVLSFEDRLYAFGISGIKVYYNGNWSDVASSPTYVSTGVASTPGLFAGGKDNDNGIFKIAKQY